ncbi:DUF3108 domain-containing protein [Gallaecimonas pentaromativorans]|uniref:DUF3108 domain-containing protein n=1 Tax=Gallaecimonas pentaromativorans TaxID=584787 RepID=UPI003A8D4659
MRVRNALISFMVAATLSLPAMASPLISYDATYKVLRKGKALGMGTRSLKQDGDTYILHNASDLSWLIFSDQREETATFTLGSDGQQVQASQYQYKRTGTGPDDKESESFEGDTVRSGGAGINVKGVVYDPLSYQQQLALDLAAGKKDVTYHIVKELKEKVYRFRVVGEERLSTPYGDLDTLRVERVRDNSSRETLFWLAPKLHYTLVRLWQSKDGVEQMELVLSDYKEAAAPTEAASPQ